MASRGSKPSPPPPAKDLSDEELKERVLFALKHQIRHAEEVDAVRRAMARNLARSLRALDRGEQQQQLSHPLTLVDPDTVVAACDGLSPAQRQYVEAAGASADLQRGFARARAEQQGAASASARRQREQDEEASALGRELLALALRRAALREKVGRYRAAVGHMEALRRQPAAAPGFLDPAAMFRACGPLPEMPRELMDSFTVDRGASEARARELFQRIKKESLRQKILAVRGQRQAEEARARNPPPPDPATLPPEVQLHALNAVKEHLIQWIEAHLSKAGGSGDDDEPSILESPEKKQQQPRKAEEEKQNAAADDDEEEEKKKKHDYEAQLADIQREYDRHIELRKEVMALMSYHEEMTKKFSRILKEDQEAIKKSKEDDKRASSKDEPGPPPTRITATTTTAKPGASLITPYIEKLQAIAREQKGLVQEKSHINASLAKHQQETREMLGHLAEESQLLAKYPSAASAAAKPPEASPADFNEVTKGAAAKQQQQQQQQANSNLATQLEPWLLAADAAKLATLETVAEKVEEGQMAVDEAMAALDETRKLLATGEGEGGEDVGGGSEGEQVSGKHAGKGKSIYAKLDGNLGLINE